MGIKFRTEDGQVHQVNNQTGDLERIKSHEELQKEKALGKGGSFDENYYREAIWNMGKELETLRNENRELKSQIQSITKLLM